MTRVWMYNDGGRAAAGFRGETRDCACRAIAIATDLPYEEVYGLINRLAKKPVARTGVPKRVTRQVMTELGWEWTPTMAIGSGCRVHVKADELPGGRLVLQLSRHVVAMIDGVVQDTHDSTRDGTRCVYGYWTP